MTSKMCTLFPAKHTSILLSFLAFYLNTAALSPAQSNNPVDASFFGMAVNNPPAAPWPGTLGVPFASWRTLGFRLKWSDLEQCDGGSDPTNPCYVWTNLDSAISQAKATGQDIMYTVDSTPTWASSNPSDSTCARGISYPSGSCDPPNDIDAVAGSGLGDGTNQHFVDFMTALTNHVGPGVIKYWEVWNEPNVSHAWRGTNAQLVRLAKDTWNTVKKADANALITTPPYVGSGIRLQLPAYLSAGGSQYADIVTYHGYVYTGACPNTCPVPENEISLVANLRNAIQAAGLSGKPVFDTEGSWGNYLGTATITDPDQQDAFTARYYLIHVNSSVNKLYWYSWNDTSSGHFYDTTTGMIDSAGIAYQQIYDWLVGATLTAPCNTLNTQWSCFFTRSNGYLSQTLWDVDPSLVCSGGICPTVNVAVPTNFSQYRDLAGNTTPVANQTVPVGSKPILVEGTTPDISVTMTSSAATATPGGTETYTVALTNNTAAGIANVTVLDNLDPTLTLTSCSSSPNGVCQTSGNNLTVTFDSMASAESDTITIVVQVSSTASGTILNTATANWINALGNAADNWATVPVSAGTVAGSVMPNSVNFGNDVLQVASAAKNITVSNVGTANLVINNITITGPNAAEFSYSSGTLPMTILPNAHSIVSVQFTAAALGLRTATLYLYYVGSANPLAVALGGNGVSPTTTTLQSSLDPSVLGQPVTFTSQVTCSSGAMPTGNISLKRGSTVLATLSLNSSGGASYTTSTLPAGWANILSTYGGDSNCGPSKASISQGVKLPTTVSLSSSTNPSTVGQAVTFTATVTSPNGGTPAGSLSFKDGSIKLATVTVGASGTASITTSKLAKGSHSMTAAYSGNSTFAPSTSATVIQSVN